MSTKQPWLKAQMLISFAAVLLIGFTAALAVSLTSENKPTQIGLITLGGGNGKVADLSMPYWNVEYVLGQGLTDSTEEAKAYRLHNSLTVDDTAEFIALIFNVRGEQWSAEQNGARSVWIGKKLNGYTDYNSPAIMASSPGKSAPTNWTYNAAMDATVSVRADNNGEPIDENNPDDAAMRKTANSYLYGLNAPLDKLKITSSASYGYGYVTANLVLDGVESNLGWTFSFDSQNSLVAASGLDFRIVEAESFKTVSQVDAFKRITDYKWNADFYGYPMMVAYPEYNEGVTDSGSAVGGAVGSTDAVAPTLEPAPDVAPSEPSVIAPAPDYTVEPEPMPTDYIEPPKQIVTIDIAEATLALVYDDKGNAYLLPAYKMSDVSREHVYHVFAFAEGAVKLPENLIMPMMSTK